MKFPNKSPLQMAVVRGVRESAIAFYAQFKKISISYIAAYEREFQSSIRKFPKNFVFHPLPFSPAWRVDPLTILQDRINNLSWQHIQGIEPFIKDADVVNITDTYYFFNRQVVDLARKYKKPVVTTLWTTIPQHITTWIPPYSFNTRSVVQNTNLFILRSKLVYRFTDSLAIDRKKTVMIYKGVDLNHFYPRKRSQNKQVTILFVGNLHPCKGVLELVSAFEQLVKNGLPVRLIIAGSGILVNFLKKKAEYLPVTNLGFVPYNDLGKVYRQADIFCSPSRDMHFFGIKIWEEYFSYTLMEAQASGLAIVTTQSGGISEEVDKENPLVPQRNAKLLYKALKNVVENDKKRSYLGKQNRKRAELLFDGKRQAQKTEDAILGVIRNLQA